MIECVCDSYRVSTTLLADNPNAIIAKWLREYQSQAFNKYVDDEAGHEGYAVLRVRFSVLEASGHIGSLVRSGSMRRRKREYGALLNLHRVREVAAESVTFSPTNLCPCENAASVATGDDCLDSQYLQTVSVPAFCWDQQDALNEQYRHSQALPNCVMVLSERCHSDSEARSVLLSAPPFFRIT